MPLRECSYALYDEKGNMLGSFTNCVSWEEQIPVLNGRRDTRRCPNCGRVTTKLFRDPKVK